MIDRIANGRTDLVFEYLEQSLMSLRDTPNYEKKRNQVAAATEGGDPSADGEPGEGSRPKFPEQLFQGAKIDGPGKGIRQDKARRAEIVYLQFDY